MGLAVKLRARAKRDLAHTVDRIGLENADAAIRWLAAVQHDMLTLADHPKGGRLRSPAGKSLRGLRSWPVGGFEDYLIFYLPKRTAIEIVRVIHGAQDTGRIFGER